MGAIYKADWATTSELQSIGEYVQRSVSMMQNTLLQESKCAFTDLRKQMPLFANAIAEKKHAVNGFDEYLDFYQLPEAKHNL